MLDKSIQSLNIGYIVANNTHIIHHNQESAQLLIVMSKLSDTHPVVRRDTPADLMLERHAPLIAFPERQHGRVCGVYVAVLPEPPRVCAGVGGQW